MLVPQKNVPMPAVKRPTLRNRRKYPLNTMDLGEFFFVADKTDNILSTHVSVEGKKLGRKFATRLVNCRQTPEGWKLCRSTDIGAVPGIGVWRIE